MFANLHIVGIDFTDFVFFLSKRVNIKISKSDSYRKDLKRVWRDFIRFDLE